MRTLKVPCVLVHQLAIGRRRLRVWIDHQQRRGHGRPRGLDRRCDGHRRATAAPADQPAARAAAVGTGGWSAALPERRADRAAARRRHRRSAGTGGAARRRRAEPGLGRYRWPRRYGRRHRGCGADGAAAAGSGWPAARRARAAAAERRATAAVRRDGRRGRRDGRHRRRDRGHRRRGRGRERRRRPERAAAREPAARGGGAVDPVVARGQYLVNSVLGCTGCHTPQGGASLSGTDCFVKSGTTGCLSSANLTNDPSGAHEPHRSADQGRVHEGHRSRASRGKFLFSNMPYYQFGNLTDADANAIVAYLRTVPGVSHTVQAATAPFDVQPTAADWAAGRPDALPSAGSASRPRERQVSRDARLRDVPHRRTRRARRRTSTRPRRSRAARSSPRPSTARRRRCRPPT